MNDMLDEWTLIFCWISHQHHQQSLPQFDAAIYKRRVARFRERERKQSSRVDSIPIQSITPISVWCADLFSSISIRFDFAISQWHISLAKPVSIWIVTWQSEKYRQVVLFFLIPHRANEWQWQFMRTATNQNSKNHRNKSEPKVLALPKNWNLAAFSTQFSGN